MLFACLLTTASLLASRYRIEWVAPFASNLAAGFLGSFLTVLLIDRALERERRTQNERIQKVAFAQVRPAILRHLIVLSDWYKAAIPQPPAKQPTKFEELFNEDYFREIQYLDFSKFGPRTAETWLAFTRQEFDSLRVEIRLMIDKYAFFLDADALELLEGISNSVIINAVINLAQVDLIARDRAGNINRRYNVLGEESFIREVREHIRKLNSFISLFNSKASDPLDLASLGLWRTDVSPGFGSARVSPDDFQSPSAPILLGKHADLPKF